MDRIWQWVWDRFGTKYSWVFCAITFTLMLLVYLLWSMVVASFEASGDYFETAALTVVAVMVLAYLTVLPGRGWSRLAEQWAGGHEVDRAKALEATYMWSRGTAARAVGVNAVGVALLLVVVGAIAGASPWRLVQYGILGAVIGTCVQLIAVHSYAEAALRPVRAALAGDTGIGDSLPRSRPTFAAWTNASMLASALAFTLTGAMLAAVIDQTSEIPLLSLAIGGGMTVVFAVPMTVGAMLSPSLLPIHDLAGGTERVAAGDYSQHLPVVQDDDLGALAASFNRMQSGLAERQRLQAAFGTYVDPALAARLLEQGDDVFSGERREVTVMFIDIRDFTPFAEANTAEDTVARLNALFEIVVPAVVDAGGHVNKFLGDGALAVFGAPNDLAHHADAAVSAAVLIQRLVGERFGGALRIGIGINTGVVIAGTIGGGGKLEFTLIGDAVNVAARVEQLTKSTGDAILLTQQVVESLVFRPLGMKDRGFHSVKGKSAAVQVFALDMR
ncbi:MULTISPECIES: adenylate/guanylate cyclase domain-containing protein [unclassified Mycolicibacterium]|uniref:adenylate/guanylate cyclase domain-containing protein n=1 Tax=unclassified Mycolicibacterium TaxID=2636767 RepID=UPI0012DBF4E4|nr:MULTISPECIES: adenylate/guanylate cyclase domain-containing protein [unclassified Mycolicibacterium]MUL81260.1 adenylate/guanylate cyclase domain-containing protein [Mycolicibacterium sp. CBMA 329]MUL87026.1 adenylate/guanylate cyclase domain-containing protein [Mycolicibacterium sp. CBMA 331]MUL98691.1 adenylate/guanylate cyclase domain-containing protein [Mycolicibacterium sp. CBMA 334]MUM25554.1 adenylate/guanylate cyclase domain-containing protein [Mycolicibacterium sp. CBMA 295]MUM3732